MLCKRITVVWSASIDSPIGETYERVMNPTLSRRQFLATSTAAAGLAFTPRWARAAVGNTSQFSFVLLGDLHFDQLDHHDMNWVQKEKPNDVRQIENYSRITREVSPVLLKTVRETVAELNRTPATRVAFVLQAGDLVEGLCGSEELSVRQNTEALILVRDAKLEAPFLFTKGNHDIAGPGAIAAFRTVFHPFLTDQARAVERVSAEVTSGSYSVTHGNAQFAFFDAYEAGKSLEWFEALAARRTAEHLFVVVHPPVVPYGAGNVNLPRCGMKDWISPAERRGLRPAPVAESTNPPGAWACACATPASSAGNIA